jgi:hypothetical protein
MLETTFHVPDAKRDRLAVVYEPAPGGGIRRIPDDPPVVVGNLQYSPSYVYSGPGTYFSGGGGLVSTAYDYARLLQMLLNGGELGGHRVLSLERVQNLTTNAIGTLRAPFGMGSFDVTLAPQGLEWPGTFAWDGFWNTYYQADPLEQLVLVELSQLHPNDGAPNFWNDFSQAAYEAITEPRIFMTRSSRNVTLRWRLSSLVPRPGRQLLPGFHLLQTPDLDQWQDLIPSQIPALGNPRTLSRSMSFDSSVQLFRGEWIRDFSDRDFTGARLAQADLRWTLLSKAVLDGADLSGSDLRWADLTGAILRRANLTDANLSGALGFDTNQDGIIYGNTILPDGSRR